MISKMASTLKSCLRFTRIDTSSLTFFGIIGGGVSGLISASEAYFRGHYATMPLLIIGGMVGGGIGCHYAEKCKR